MNYEAFHALSYGLYVVGAASDGKYYGYIANTAFQVTAEPSRIAISCHKNNNTRAAIVDSGVFSLSVLHQEVKPALIKSFGYSSAPGLDKFSEFTHMTGKSGAPILIEDAVAYFECRVTQEMDLGSHTLFIGEVVAAVQLREEKEPITYRYYQQVFKARSPKNSPTFQKAEERDPQADSPSDGQWLCPACGFVYDPQTGDPDGGIDPGTAFEDIPEDWVCPVCGVGKSDFIPFS